MKALFKLELKRDAKKIIGILLVVFALSLVKYIYVSTLEVVAICWIFLFSILFSFFIFIPVNSFSKDRSLNVEEYLLSLPIKRWKVFLTKILYSSCIISLFILLVFIFPEPKAGPKDEIIDRILHDDPKYIFLYWILGILIFFSLCGFTRGKGSPIKRYKSSYHPGVIIFLLLILPLVGLIAYDEKISTLPVSVFNSHKLLILPFIFGFAGPIITLSLVSYCRYEVRKVFALRLLLIYIFSFVGLLIFQFSYSYLNLNSLSNVERASAISSFIYLWESKALESFKSSINENSDDDSICKTARPFFADIEKARPLSDFLVSKVETPAKIQRAVFITLLSMLGENEEAFGRIKSKLMGDEKFARIFTSPEWAQRLFFLAPPEKWYDLTVEFLTSNNPALNHIGYHCARLSPNNDYVPLILQKMRTEKWGEDFEEAVRSILLIALDKEAIGEISIQDFDLIAEKLNNWYHENGDNDFDTRFIKLLKEKGYKIEETSISEIPTDKLVSIYLSERESCGYSDPTFYLISTILRYRLKTLDYFSKCDYSYDIFFSLDRKIDLYLKKHSALKAQ